MINIRVIAYILGLLFMIEAGFMGLSVPVSLFYKEHDTLPILYASLIPFISGFLLWILFRRSDKNVGKHEGYIIVSMGWILLSFFGSLPFILSGAIPSIANAYFETMSGFTTTGATILNNVEGLSYGLHLWRSMTQWLGGMGIIVLSLVVLPILGIGGMQLYAAEVPGPVVDKLHPRIRETAKRLWGLYLVLTLAQVLLLTFGKMSLFDAICHSFTTMATGGYSTKQAGIAYYGSPFIQYVFIVFMALAGVNFALTYMAVKLRFKSIWKNEEFRAYLLFILIFSVFLTLFLFVTTDTLSLEKKFRDALFQVVSIMTTTGFVTTNYMNWLPPGYILLLLLMFFGGSAGSTGGSIKIVRIVLLIKSGVLELKRMIHPNAIIPVRMDKEAIKPEILIGVLSFVSVYIMIVVIGTVVVSFLGYDFETSVSAVASCLGNIGPGLGKVGPMESYSHFNDFGKWFLSFLMLIGRLELFTVLILFTPAFWKR